MATLPLPLDYPVHDMADWLAIRHHYEFAEERFAADWVAHAQTQAAAGRVISISLPGGFWEARELLGDVDLCMAYYTQPALVHDIIETFTETACRVLERVTAEAQVDRLSIAEDLAGKGGPLIGPKQFKAFIAPYYRRVWDLLSSRGARLFCVDTDGNFEALIPAMIEAGVNVMQPMEPAAGMDIVTLRRKYGTAVAFNGGIDKHVLRQGRAEIDAELEYKIPPMVRTGGGVLGLDHRVTNGTPIAAYRYYIEKVWQIIEREEGI
jgi:uroporphyrinogen-III decarboxylase